MPTNDTRGLWHGKRINNGEWFVGYLYGERDGVWYLCDRFCERYGVDPSTRGECTGLRDKNGKLIFEGDIVKIDKATIKRFEGRYGVVKWLNDYASFALVFGHQWLFWNDYIFEENCEVIGNIHDNPELLKGADEDGQD